MLSSRFELIVITASGDQITLAQRRVEMINLLASTADSTIHLLIANRPRPPARTSPKRGTSSIGKAVAAIRNNFNPTICIIMQSIDSPPSAVRRSSFDSWKRAPATPPHVSRIAERGFR